MQKIKIVISDPFQVSVIIPVFNAAKFVKSAVMSALNHSEVYEVILVEDGSNDGSFDICFELSTKHPRVRFYHHHKRVNKGAGESRNLGLQKASCPFVAFLDSDDTYNVNRFARCREVFANDSSIDGTYDLVFMTVDEAVKTKVFGIKKAIDSADLFRYILRGGYFHTNSLTVRKRFLDRISPHFMQPCWPHEDVEFWLRMAFYGKLVNAQSSEPVATYRIHGANNIHSVGSCQSRLRLWSAVREHFSSRDIGFLNHLLIMKQLGRYKWAHEKQRWLNNFVWFVSVCKLTFGYTL
jgi:glycosyltransferase involved in cell wall biosynthesis